MAAPWSTASSSALRQLRSSVVGASSSRSAGLGGAQRHASTSVMFSLASFTVRVDFRIPTLPSFSQTPQAPAAPLALASECDASPVPSSSSAAASEDEDPLAWDGLLNAVPKKKVSHSRKSMRSANKGLKDRVDFNHCPACGKPKLTHHICASCFGDIARRQKADIRAQAEAKVLAAGRPAAAAAAAAAAAEKTSELLSSTSNTSERSPSHVATAAEGSPSRAADGAGAGAGAA
ncbi:unnamed protein product [Parajaminaea phylloscopi]